MNREKSKELYNRAIELMPGGVSSPVRAFKSVGGEPIFMAKGEGVHLTDEDGNSYIDYCMSWGPLILGHADKSVTTAIGETALKGTSFGMPHRYEVQLAEMLAKRFDSIEKVRFVNSGTEAVMSAIRLARGYSGRKKFIKCTGCYHGHADHLLVSAGSGVATLGIPGSAGVTEENVRNTILIPYNDASAFEETLKMDADDIAAIIIEPVPCNYGLILPEKGYLKRVRELCDEYGVLLIFDEVISGLRLAPGGAQEYFDIKADITTLGKVIGGGLPVGAYGASSKIMSTVAPEGPVYQAGTLSGNPLAMAAGIATLSRMEDIDGYKILKENTEYFVNIVKDIVRPYAGKMIFTNIESIFAFIFTHRNSISCVTHLEDADMELFSRFHNKMLQRGVYFAPSGYEVGFISTAHKREDLDKTATAIDETLKEIF